MENTTCTNADVVFSLIKSSLSGYTFIIPELPAGFQLKLGCPGHWQAVDFPCAGLWVCATETVLVVYPLVTAHSKMFN